MAEHPFFSDQATHTQPIMCNNGQRVVLLRVTILIENRNRQLKHLLSKMVGDEGMKDWLVQLHECVLKLNTDMKRAKGCPYRIVSLFFW